MCADPLDMNRFVLSTGDPKTNLFGGGGGGGGGGASGARGANWYSLGGRHTWPFRRSSPRLLRASRLPNKRLSEPNTSLRRRSRRRKASSSPHRAKQKQADSLQRPLPTIQDSSNCARFSMHKRSPTQLQTPPSRSTFHRMFS